MRGDCYNGVLISAHIRAAIGLEEHWDGVGCVEWAMRIVT